MAKIYTRQEVKRRRTNFQIFAGIYDFIGVVVGIAVIVFIRNPRRARARKEHEQALREAQARAAQEAAEPPAGDYTEPPVPSPEPAEPPAQDYAGKENEGKD